MQVHASPYKSMKYIQVNASLYLYQSQRKSAQVHATKKIQVGHANLMKFIKTIIPFALVG